MGMSAFPSFMTQATPATQPLINAEPAVAAQTEQNPQVGQVMPGVQGADAPVVAQNCGVVINSGRSSCSLVEPASLVWRGVW